MLRPRLLDGVAFGLLTIVTPRFLPAQVLVRGLAYDSLARRPLAGATIILQQLNRATIADSAGRFTLDSLAPGRYVLLLADSELDAVGLPTIATGFEVADRPVEVMVTVPSIRTLWRHLCGTDSIGADSGIVFGTVRDLATDSLLAGMTVGLSWPVIEITDSKHVRVDQRSTRTQTDSTGLYRTCGVGTEINVQAQAGDERWTTGIIQLMLTPRPLARRDFVVSRDPAWLSVLRGKVRSDVGQPIPAAMVIVDGQDSAATDAAGRFTLAHVFGGTQWLRVRATGFAPLERSVDVVRVDQELALDLQAIVLMDTIKVVASIVSPQMREFAERRRVGSGYSLQGEEIRKAANLQSVFRQFPSLIVAPRMTAAPTLINGRPVPPSGEAADTRFPGSFAVFMSRGAMMSSYCLANLFIDGIESVWDQIGSYKPEDIIGIEVYPRQSVVPTRFQKISSGCGAVLVWTKELR
ncbi:MAG TPA: carboxypeptidase regulatory-like domain-containing protein [Gemmatimonadales bacterium]|nr:carboxypeptidase regulatory-like domain-containing protein [Gemmatimonadales bacterium]